MKDALPRAVGKHIVALVGEVDIDSVVAVGTADVVHEREGEHLRMAAEIPVVRLLSRKSGAVDAALLARAHADGLTVFHIADGVGLGVFERDEGKEHIALCALGQVFIFGDDVREQALIDFAVVVPLLKGDAENILLLQRRGSVGGVDLHDVVFAALFRL